MCLLHEGHVCLHVFLYFPLISFCDVCRHPLSFGCVTLLRNFMNFLHVLLLLFLLLLSFLLFLLLLLLSLLCFFYTFALFAFFFLMSFPPLSLLAITPIFSHLQANS